MEYFQMSFKFTIKKFFVYSTYVKLLILMKKNLKNKK